MTDDEAFLAAIAARPSDDLTRLVYADWLEERDDPRAAYVRLTVEAAKGVTQSPPDTRALAELRRVADQFETGWREIVGKRFDLVLESFEPNQKIRTIVDVRAVTGWGSAEAKDCVDRVPSVAVERLLLEDADRLRDDLESGTWTANEFRPAGRLPAGETCCRVSIRPHP